MMKHWRGEVAFAPPAATNEPLAITSLRAWRLHEPVSGRRYTVVKLESRAGTVGFGEGGGSVSTDVAEAKSAVAGRRATDAEFIRHRLASWLAMEADGKNAM